MALFKESFVSFLNWTLITLVVTFSFILPVVLQAELGGAHPTGNATSSEFEGNSLLGNYKNGSNSERMKMTMNKLTEIKETLSEMEFKSDQILCTYKKVRAKLKDEVTRTESQCKALYSLIHRMPNKKLKGKMEIKEKSCETPSKFAIPSTE